MTKVSLSSESTIPSLSVFYAISVAVYRLSIHNLKLVRPLFRPIYGLQTQRPFTRLFKIKRIIHTSHLIRWFVRSQYKMEAPSFCILDGLLSWLKLVSRGGSTCTIVSLQ